MKPGSEFASTGKDEGLQWLVLAVDFIDEVFEFLDIRHLNPSDLVLMRAAWNRGQIRTDDKGPILESKQDFLETFVLWTTGRGRQAQGRIHFIRSAIGIHPEMVLGNAITTEQIGVSIIRSAVEAPLRALASNAGLEGAVIVESVLKSKGNSGFNVATEKYEDLVKAGVVDPKKVTRTALQNAGSIAGLMLTTECLITEIPEKEPPMPAGGGGHDHGMM